MNRNRMPVARLWLMVATILTFAALCPQQAQAQVPGYSIYLPVPAYALWIGRNPHRTTAHLR